MELFIASEINDRFLRIPVLATRYYDADVWWFALSALYGQSGKWSGADGKLNERSAERV